MADLRIVESDIRFYVTINEHMKCLCVTHANVYIKINKYPNN